MKEKIFNLLKKLKVLFDTYKIVLGIIALLGTVAVGTGYSVYEQVQEEKLEPQATGVVDRHNHPHEHPHEHKHFHKDKMKEHVKEFH